MVNLCLSCKKENCKARKINPNEECLECSVITYSCFKITKDKTQKTLTKFGG